MRTHEDTVMRLILERAATGSRPSERTDGARVALAIEGGGMAGTVSGGMCVALEALGLVDSFDVIYGSSAGALNASYLATRQARERSRLYELAACRGVVARSRLLRGQPAFRLDELDRRVLERHPHVVSALERAPRLRVTATRVEDAGLDVLGDFGSAEELRAAIVASSALPVLAGGPVRFRGVHYVDGGLFESIPYATALREDATHVLVLRSRHAEYRKSPFQGARRIAVDRIMRGLPDTVRGLVRAYPERYNAQAAALAHADVSGLGDRIRQLAPPAAFAGVSKLEDNPERLRTALAIGARIVYGELGTASGTSSGTWRGPTMRGSSRLLPLKPIVASRRAGVPRGTVTSTE
jgi:predicted patatin/cPLA2 family phospholipase